MDEDEDGEYLDFTVAMQNDPEEDAAAVIQMSALMLNNDGPSAYVRAMDLPLAAVGTSMAMAASMIATLAERLASYEETSAEQILMELRNWMEEEGEEDGE